MQLSCHSVTVVLTLAQTKQIRINVHKQKNTKNKVQKIQNTVNTNICVHITKTPTHYKTHPHITKPTHIDTPTHYKTHTHTHKHTLQNQPKHITKYYKTHTYTHPHITKPTHTHTHTPTH